MSVAQSFEARLPASRRARRGRAPPPAGGGGVPASPPSPFRAPAASAGPGRPVSARGRSPMRARGLGRMSGSGDQAGPRMDAGSGATRPCCDPPSRRLPRASRRGHPPLRRRPCLQASRVRPARRRTHGRSLSIGYPAQAPATDPGRASRAPVGPVRPGDSEAAVPRAPVDAPQALCDLHQRWMSRSSWCWPKRRKRL
jgi:hypothetical protein